MAESKLNRFDVVIVGAGFSGMYLVHLCRERGLSCVVLELSLIHI